MRGGAGTKGIVKNFNADTLKALAVDYSEFKHVLMRKMTMLDDIVDFILDDYSTRVGGTEVYRANLLEFMKKKYPQAAEQIEAQAAERKKNLAEADAKLAKDGVIPGDAVVEPAGVSATGAA